MTSTRKATCRICARAEGSAAISRENSQITGSSTKAATLAVSESSVSAMRWESVRTTAAPRLCGASGMGSGPACSEAAGGAAPGGVAAAGGVPAADGATPGVGTAAKGVAAKGGAAKGAGAKGIATGAAYAAAGPAASSARSVAITRARSAGFSSTRSACSICSRGRTAAGTGAGGSAPAPAPVSGRIAIRITSMSTRIIGTGHLLDGEP